MPAPLFHALSRTAANSEVITLAAITTVYHVQNIDRKHAHVHNWYNLAGSCSVVVRGWVTNVLLVSMTTVVMTLAVVILSVAVCRNDRVAETSCCHASVMSPAVDGRIELDGRRAQTKWAYMTGDAMKKLVLVMIDAVVATARETAHDVVRITEQRCGPPDDGWRRGCQS